MAALGLAGSTSTGAFVWSELTLPASTILKSGPAAGACFLHEGDALCIGPPKSRRPELRPVRCLLAVS
jgi:hypothetical protein